MTVNISAAFSKDERARDGLVAIEKTLIEEPLTRHVIVAVIECGRITHDVRKGTITPTARLVEVEVMVDDGDAQAVRELLADRFATRTGRSDRQGAIGEDGPAVDRPHDEWLDPQAD